MVAHLENINSANVAEMALESVIENKAVPVTFGEALSCLWKRERALNEMKY